MVVHPFDPCEDFQRTAAWGKTAKQSVLVLIVLPQGSLVQEPNASLAPPYLRLIFFHVHRIVHVVVVFVCLYFSTSGSHHTVP